MATIRLDHSALKLMEVFRRITGVQPKDCFTDSQDVLFFVLDGNMAQAIGRQGANVRRLEQLLKRKVKILEFNPELRLFVQNLVRPLQLHRIALEDSTVLLEAADSRSRSALIGRAAQNLRNYESIIKRYFPITEVKVQ